MKQLIGGLGLSFERILRKVSSPCIWYQRDLFTFIIVRSFARTAPNHGMRTRPSVSSHTEWVADSVDPIVTESQRPRIPELLVFSGSESDGTQSGQRVLGS